MVKELVSFGVEAPAAVFAFAGWMKLRHRHAFEKWLRARPVLGALRVAAWLPAVEIVVGLALAASPLTSAPPSISAALSSVALIAGLAVSRLGSDPCPCFGALSRAPDRTARVLLAVGCVLAAAPALLAGDRSFTQISASPTWTLGSFVAVVLGLAALSHASRPERTRNGHLAPAAQSALRSALPSPLPSYVIFFGSLSCESCLQAAEAFAKLSRSALPGGAFLDMGLAAPDGTRVSGARMVTIPTAVRKAIGVASRPSITEVHGPRFYTSVGLGPCQAAITRLLATPNPERTKSDRQECRNH